MATVKADRDCERCSLSDGAQTVCLMGRGPIPAEVMLVGEAPGWVEDDTGKPFQGTAGAEVLDPVLKAANVKRKEVYITNTVRCRPPDNRTPKAGEINACRHWMEKELRLVNPKHVILMGKTALRLVPAWRRSKLAEVVGRSINLEGITYYATYHPAACLPGRDRRGKQRAIFESNIRGFFRSIRGETKEVDLHVRRVLGLDDFNEMLDDLDREEYISFDTETMGLRQWDPELHITSMQFGLVDVQWYVPIHCDHTLFWKRQPFRGDKSRKLAAHTIGEVLRKKRVIAQNGPFDVLWAWVEYGVKYPLWFDTRLASSILNENTPNSLSYMADYYYAAGNYDLELHEKQGYRIKMRKHAKYGCLDTYYTRRIALEQHIPQLQEDALVNRFFWDVIMPAWANYITMRKRGVYVNPESYKDASLEVYSQVGTSIGLLNRVNPYSRGQELNKREQKKLDKLGFKAMNWNSPKQLAEFLFDRLSFSPLDLTKTGTRSTSASVLKRLAALPKTEEDRLIVRETVTPGKHNIAVLGPAGREMVWFDGYKQDVPQAVMDYKKGKKLQQFIESYREHMDEFHLMHPEYKLEVVTGRASCIEPNLQQTPRNPLIRGCIDAPPGWTLIAADYSQFQLRITADLADEKNMKHVFQTGGDIHLETARWVMGAEEITKDDRKKAKAVNFGFIFGMWWKKFQVYARDKYGVEFTDEAAALIREEFFARYSGLEAWHKRQKRKVHRNGYVRTKMGRKRNLPQINSDDEQAVKEAERQAINSPVQGSEAELHFAAMNELMQPPFPKILRPSGTIHDELLMWVRNGELNDNLLTDVQQIMQEPKIVREMNINYTVPIVVEIKVGPWGKGEEWQSSI